MHLLAKNIEYLMSMRGLNANSLQDKSGITQTTTSRILNGTTKNPRDSIIQKYADFFKVALSDLRYKDLTDGSSITDYLEVQEWGDNDPLADDEVAIPFYKDICLACGHGSVNNEETSTIRRLRIGKYTLSRMGIAAENAFGVTAKDDSMNPSIQDGDTVYIDKGRTEIKDGRVYAIRIGELCLCKRLYRLPNGGVRVVSDNNVEFPEIIVTKEQIMQDEFAVIGWVWNISRLYKW